RLSRLEAEEWQIYLNWDSGTVPPAFIVEVERWAVPRACSGLQFSTLYQQSEIDRYKLKLRVAEVADKTWKGWLHFDPVFFDAATVKQFAGYLVTLMTHAVHAPGSRLKDLEILSDAARNEVLFRFNPERVQPFASGTICDLFEKAAAVTPGKLAVDSASGQLTYDELNRRANKLARYLRKQGVREEMPVVILAERRPETIVGLLGTMKAGGVYVPLDPSYPRERIDFVLKDTAAAFILLRKQNANLLPENTAKLMCLDDDWQQISEEDDSNLSIQVNPENLAYVIYTSGSTGRPKGVLISHRNLLHSTMARETYYPDVLRCFLLLSAFAFDSSVAGIFWSLCTGATLYLPEERLQMDVSAIAEIVKRVGVSHLLCLPSLYSLLLKHCDGVKLASLSAVIVAGEACPRNLVAMHYQVLPGAKLYNEYGPTENTVWSTVCHVRNEPRFSTVPIGSPVAHSYVYLLDEQMNAIPFGVAGQIYVGGEGISRGYLGRADLTAERFVPDPYGTRAGACLYATGDVARYRADGQIEFLGRADNQVKVRGYRIELDEIESVLRQHPSVLEAIVTVQEDEADDRRLVAYVVPRNSVVMADIPGGYSLANGMRIAHQNKNETDYLYQEIFESQTYLRHGIELPENACIFDVGANIGMFMLFAGERCPSAKIYAFEPIPEVFAILQQNARLCSAQQVST
ncbi:MAG: amino acid adenylation domain-containing protein, partial [Candidatus Angelobacter sp.]